MSDTLMFGLAIVVGIGAAVALVFASRDFIRGVKSGKAEFDAAKSSRRSKEGLGPSDAMKDQTPPRSGE
jgi:hypothetical protein